MSAIQTPHHLKRISFLALLRALCVFSRGWFPSRVRERGWGKRQECKENQNLESARKFAWRESNHQLYFWHYSAKVPNEIRFERLPFQENH